MSLCKTIGCSDQAEGRYSDLNLVRDGFLEKILTTKDTGFSRRTGISLCKTIGCSVPADGRYSDLNLVRDGFLGKILTTE